MSLQALHRAVPSPAVPRFGAKLPNVSLRSLEQSLMQAEKLAGHTSNPLPLRNVIAQIQFKIHRLLANKSDASRKMKHKLTTDKLTGLKNLEFFEKKLVDALKKAGRSNRPLSLIFFDLNRFKGINDKYGHTVGDQALQRFANALKLGIGKEGYACRKGGDEFVGILPNMGEAAAILTAQRISRVVKAASFTTLYKGKRMPVMLNASQGICTVNDAQAKTLAKQLASYHSKRFKKLPDRIGTTEQFQDVADKVMYEAKRRSKTRKHEPGEVMKRDWIMSHPVRLKKS